MDSTRGKLLIAGPKLQDPNFWRTVILVVEHNDEGALGLVLNRPSESSVSDVVPELAELVDPDTDVLVGGPVQPSSVIVLADFDDPHDAALIAFDAVGVMSAGSDPTDLATDVHDARAFAGHAGWGPGQLDNELERGDWILEPAQLNDAFAADPEQLWSDVLARKGGSYALVARMPRDPSAN
ncbi:MAG: YqgE/AlgH family protein [Solirubrobacterales bacterium]|nr:YqgE/AlgH family protein [Solirubrobacterales bacterium]